MQPATNPKNIITKIKVICSDFMFENMRSPLLVQVLSEATVERHPSLQRHQRMSNEYSLRCSKLDKIFVHQEMNKHVCKVYKLR
jgi:hypothetical protein